MKLVFLGRCSEDVVKKVHQKYRGLVDIEVVIDNVLDYLTSVTEEEIFFIASCDVAQNIEMVFINKDNIYNLSVYHMRQGKQNVYSVSQKGKDKYLYLQKKRCIEKCGSLMKKTGVKNLYINLVGSRVEKVDVLEANIIRLLIDNQYEIEKLEACSISNFLDEMKKENIYKTNMLIFKSFEMQSFFNQIAEKTICDHIGNVYLYNKWYLSIFGKNDIESNLFFLIDSIVLRAIKVVGNNSKKLNYEKKCK